MCSRNACTFLWEFFGAKHTPIPHLSQGRQIIRDIFTQNSVHRQFFIILVLLFDSKTVLCYFETIVGKIGRQICQSGIGIVICIFLCLIGIGIKKFPIGIVVFVFLCLFMIGRKICPIGIVGFVFLCLLGIGRKKFQLEFLLM